MDYLNALKISKDTDFTLLFLLACLGFVVMIISVVVTTYKINKISKENLK